MKSASARNRWRCATQSCARPGSTRWATPGRSAGRGLRRLVQLERLARDRGRGSFRAARDLHRRVGELDAVLCERLLDHGVGAAPDGELLVRPGLHLDADLDRVVAELLHALHLERLEDLAGEFRLLGEALADLLDQLLGL